MRHFRSFVLTALCCAASAGLAQDGPPGGFGPPGGGFGGGFGGPGFGPPPGMPGSGFSVLEMPEVQQELKLSDEQREAVRQIAEATQKETRGVFEGLMNGGQAQPPGPEMFEGLRAKFDGINGKAIDNARLVLDAEQNARLSQLMLQREGTAGLVSKETAELLALTPEQLEKLQSLIGGIHPFISPDERAGIDKDANAVLTADQQTKLASLKGAAFEFPQQQFGGPGGFGPPGGGFGPPGMGGPGGMFGGERKLLAEFDANGDGWLNKEERTAARKATPAGGRGGGGRGFGPPGGFGGGNEEPVSPGERIAPDAVAASDAPLYDAHTIRTIFLNFEDDEWEAEMEAFNNTDVDVPATMIVDGETFEQVGVHFRGMSSFGTVPSGHKRSLNVSVDFLNEDQKLHGYSTLNLLNAHTDSSFLHTVLYLQAARTYIAAPQANFVRVVINGENWGVYVSAQQFNKEFLKDNFASSKGARWKVQGSPGGRGGLEYLGDDQSEYERIYTLKTSNGDEAWPKLIELCRVLNETPADKLEAALAPILDVEGALWFLALENALINSDGYWVRASDYCIYLDGDDTFHIIPHDANETFQPGMGPGMGGGRGGRGGRGGGGFGFGGGGFGGGGFGGGPGQRPPLEGEAQAENAPRREAGGAGDAAGGAQPNQDGRPRGDNAGGRGPRGGGMGGPGGGGGVTLDPLIGLDDASKPLRSKLLAVPALKQKYLSYVRTIAEDWLDWKKLGPVVDGYADVITPHIEADTKKLSSFAAFQAAIATEGAPPAAEQPAGAPGNGPPGGFGRGARMSLKQFADQRRAFLLEHPEVKAVDRTDFKRVVEK